ncbi:MAG: NRDE family protein [Luteimonas sp.]
MCLIALAWRVHPQCPLVLIANRDEFHARPTAAAGIDPDAAEVFGGRDLVQGGSWLQVSAHRRLAAVTNVRAGRSPPEAAPRSRGALVRDAVRGQSDAAQSLRALQATAHEYGRFNLLLWDGDALGFASNHPRTDTHTVQPGLHAMSNGAFDADWPKSGRALQALSRWLASSAIDAVARDAADALSPLFDALRDDTPAPDVALPDTGVGLDLERALSPPFVSGARYGTRCSTVVIVGADGFRFAERRFGPDGVLTGNTCVRRHWSAD